MKGVGGGRGRLYTDLPPTLSLPEGRGGDGGTKGGGGEEGDYILTYRLHCHYQNEGVGTGV